MAPHPWRPIAELDHEDIVEFRLLIGSTEHHVTGRMLVGGVHPHARAYYFRNAAGDLQFCSPIAWRETPWADVEISTRPAAGSAPAESLAPTKRAEAA